jgi:hypothetical protein
MKTEKELLELANKYSWEHISIYQKLSEAFIEKYADKVDLVYISMYQKLSDVFIEKHKDKVDWIRISMCQKLSEPFIEKYADKVEWYYISEYQKLSKPFIEKHKDKITLSDNSWLYKSGDYKLNAIKETGLYEIEGDYIIGYKGIRSNRYSKYNFQYQYMKGVTYESHADFNCDNENSFGLSVWTKEKATDYCNELVVKVKIHKDDLAALVHDGGKIRCTKLTVLN